ncbi:calmodulin family protein [Striga asiatica]|uniref:Calmodulin family protein n=1 Tax=Striga asiatica TaxID=4170 RepID=A0A5A7P7G3_STRAF|nr:calmodulin family protein [Striga asiatica]
MVSSMLNNNISIAVSDDGSEDPVTCVRSRFRHKRRKPFLRDRPELARKLLTKFFRGGPLYCCSSPSLSYSTSLSKLGATMGEVRCKGNLNLLEFSEFLALVTSMLLPVRSPYTEEQLKHLFKMFDRDANGYIRTSDYHHPTAINTNTTTSPAPKLFMFSRN